MILSHMYYKVCARCIGSSWLEEWLSPTRLLSLIWGYIRWASIDTSTQVQRVTCVNTHFVFVRMSYHERFHLVRVN